MKLLPKKSMLWSWKDVILVNMGIHQKPDIDSYFSTDWLEYQPFERNLFKKRVLLIFWNLHLCQPPYYKHKYNILGTNVIFYIDKKYIEFYSPFNKRSVDENSIGLKGKVLLKVCNKETLQIWEIKIYVLTDSTNSFV